LDTKLSARAINVGYIGPVYFEINSKNVWFR